MIEDPRGLEKEEVVEGESFPNPSRNAMLSMPWKDASLFLIFSLEGQVERLEQVFLECLL